MLNWPFQALLFVISKQVNVRRVLAILQSKVNTVHLASPNNSGVAWASPGSETVGTVDCEGRNQCFSENRELWRLKKSLEGSWSVARTRLRDEEFDIIPAANR